MCGKKIDSSHVRFRGNHSKSWLDRSWLNWAGRRAAVYPAPFARPQRLIRIEKPPMPRQAP
jgi:hypothetical protein